jgi:hypothetical protein
MNLLRHHWREFEKWPYLYGVPLILAALFVGLIIGTIITILEWWI